ncbi:MAG: lipopolysaccharide assembly protein LapA domain-containing protein [Bacillota bacterium]|uniref:lipopolysaccharide assembly protein LapA domain-containing protein n=1 Tax=Desulfurispora thermophila TaxID=265470 RepID=UPI0003A577C5|nr:LapA family protein [Desulfurispora thermophila]
MSKGQLFFFFALILSAMVTIFALQNAVPVSINLLFWHIEGFSIVLLILLSALAGALTTLLLGIWWQFKRFIYIRNLESENIKLKNQLQQLCDTPNTPAHKLNAIHETEPSTSQMRGENS